MDDAYIPVPCVCCGTINNYNDKDNIYEVNIYNSPYGDTNGPIFAKEIYPAGMDGNLKPGDRVNVLVNFIFDNVEMAFNVIQTNSSNYIIGTFQENSISDLTIDHPMTKNDNDRIVFRNRKSGAGVVLTDIGTIILSTSGSTFSSGVPFGYGIYEDLWITKAQNHSRIISNTGKYLLSKEHFGMFSGYSDKDKQTRSKDSDFPINYRRFVTQTKSPQNWVSTCEGAYDPWYGPNNNSERVEIRREILFSKIINYGTSRATVEMGQPGDDFISVRIDDVKLSEKSEPVNDTASPRVVGNRFKLQISDKGVFDVRMAGKGKAGINNDGFHMSVDVYGNLTIHASANIEISHGDKDGDVNSIKMNPKTGIDITATNGVRVNKLPLITKKFLDWMNQFKTQLCQTTSPGGPSPINPVALPQFTQGIQQAGNFLTDDTGSKASGEIVDDDTNA